MTESEKQAYINKAVKWIVDTTNDNSHGYSIPNPTGPDYKCSTLVFFGWRHAGVLKKENASANVWGAGTAHFQKILAKRSDFTNVKKKVNINKCKTLTKGDILMRNSGSIHTAQYIGNCKLSEATGNADGRQGDSGGHELWTHGYYNGSWTHVYRYTPKISETKKAKSVQNKQTNNSGSKRSQGEPKVYKAPVYNSIVRTNLTCKESDLTDLEKDFCAYQPAAGGEAALQSTIQNATSTVYGWIGIISVIVIVIGGVKYITSAGDPNKIVSAKNTITYAFIGLIITLLAFAITNFIIGALG